MVARLLRVEGEVQGVGFRHYVWRHAKKLGLKGYVKNLPDGGVEILAVGPEGLIETLVERLRAARAVRVDRILLQEARPGQEPQDFTIERG